MQKFVVKIETLAISVHMTHRTVYPLLDNEHPNTVDNTTKLSFEQIDKPWNALEPHQREKYTKLVANILNEVPTPENPDVSDLIANAVCGAFLAQIKPY